MDDAFHARLSRLPEAGLRACLDDPLGYRTEAVEAVLDELARRGAPVDAAEAAAIRQRLAERDARRYGGPGPWDRLLGTEPRRRRHRARCLTAAILVLGLGASAAVWRFNPPPARAPLGFEPEESKRYLRQLEMVGGRANVVGVQAQRWLAGLWQGPQLGLTLAWLTTGLAAAVWLTARPRDAA